MKRYGKVSDKTNRELKKAGLELVKDDHGDYEVITNSKMDEKCGRRKSMKEDVSSWKKRRFTRD